MDYYHIGLAVIDVEAAMEEIGGRLGVTWRPVMEATMDLDDGHGTVASLPMKFVYSAGGPPAIELFRAIPGTVFELGGSSFHHIGYWSSDLVADSVDLAAKGWPLAGTLASPDPGPARFALHTTTLGFNVELVDRWFDRPWLQDLLP